MKVVSILKVAYQVLAAIAVIIGIIVGYNQLRIWQTEGKSHMDELIRGVLIVVFVGCVIGGGLLHFLAARMNRATSSKNQLQQNAKADEPFPNSPVAAATRLTFESLSVSQRFLVREIYEHPRTALVFLGTTLSGMGFPPRVSANSLNAVLITNLVLRDSTGHVAPNPDVKGIVEKLLESSDLPLPKIVKQVNAETSEAVKTDCNLGCNSLLSDLKQEHLKKLQAARIDFSRSGACDMLIDQAKCLQQELKRIIDEDVSDTFERKLWRCPLDPEIINAAKGALWSWQHRAWSKWNGAFWNHCFAVKNFGPKYLDTDLTKATEVRDDAMKLNNEQMFKALEKHQEALVAARAQLLNPYEDSGDKVVSA